MLAPQKYSAVCYLHSGFKLLSSNFSGGSERTSLAMAVLGMFDPEFNDVASRALKKGQV